MEEHRCYECSKEAPSIFCISCSAFLCGECFAKSHTSNLGRSHLRVGANVFESREKRVGLKTARDAIIQSRVTLKESLNKAKIDKHKIQKVIGTESTSVGLMCFDKRNQNALSGRAQMLLNELELVDVEAKAKYASQANLVKVWEEQIERIGRTLSRNLDEVTEAVNRQLVELSKRMFDLSSGELNPLYKSMESVASLITELDNANNKLSEPERIESIKKRAREVAENPNIMMAPEGTVAIRSLIEDARRLSNIAGRIGTVRIRFQKDDLYESGLGLLADKEYHKAFEIFNRAAKMDHFGSKLELAICYWSGTGCRKDFGMAFKLASDAYNMPEGPTNGKCASFLADLYIRGQGIARDTETALRIALPLAEKSDRHCLQTLADVFDDPALLPLEKQVEWIKRSVDAGNTSSQLKLANMYITGEATGGVDYKLAQKLYESAAASGNSEAMLQIALNYHYGRGVSVSLPMALEFYRKACEADNTTAQFTLGYLYESGNGVEKNLVEAVKWYKLAAELGEKAAQVRAAYLLEEDHDGLPADVVAAGRYYKAAGDQGDAFAQYKMGQFMQYGKGSAIPDILAAVYWYGLSAAQEYGHAQVALGNIYMDGDGVSKDMVLAVQWYQKAARNNIGEGLYRLGMAYVEATGVAYDLETGKNYLRQSAAVGNEKAEYVLNMSAKSGFFMSTTDVRKTLGG